MFSNNKKYAQIEEICKIAKESSNTEEIILKPASNASKIIGDAVGGRLGEHIKNKGIVGSYIDAVKWSENELRSSVTLLINKLKKRQDEKDMEKILALMEEQIKKQEKIILELEEKIRKYEEKQKKNKWWKKSGDLELEKMTDKLYEQKVILSAMSNALK